MTATRVNTRENAIEAPRRALMRPGTDAENASLGLCQLGRTPLLAREHTHSYAADGSASRSIGSVRRRVPETGASALRVFGKLGTHWAYRVEVNPVNESEPLVQVGRRAAPDDPVATT
jgi:hypothetical protein